MFSQIDKILLSFFFFRFECRGDSCFPKQGLIKRAFRGQGPGNYEPEGLRQRPPGRINPNSTLNVAVNNG